MQNKFDDDIPSAPPLDGFSRVNQVSEKRQTYRADAKPSLASTSGSSVKVDPNMNRSTKHDATEANTPEVSVRYIFVYL